jgi:carbon monoxide dehydrogenase subunit G
MLRFMLPVVATTAFIVSATSAFALESNVTVKSSMPPDVVWKKIGDFCGIKSWIPAVSDCVISPDGKQRTVSLKGGGEVVERLDNWDDAKRSYTYSILSGPLPVSNYRSTLSVLPDGNGSALNWHSTYQAKGTSDAEAKKLIDGIYQDNAKSLLGG